MAIDKIKNKTYYQRYTEKMARILEVILVNERSSVIPFGPEMEIYKEKLKNDVNIIAQVVNVSTNTQTQLNNSATLNLDLAKNRLSVHRTKNKQTSSRLGI